MTISEGTLPLRNPGILISRPSPSATLRMRVSTSAASTSASTRTRELGSSATVVFIGSRT